MSELRLPRITVRFEPSGAHPRTQRGTPPSVHMVYENCPHALMASIQSAVRRSDCQESCASHADRPGFLSALSALLRPV